MKDPTWSIKYNTGHHGFDWKADVNGRESFGCSSSYRKARRDMLRAVRRDAKTTRILTGYEWE